MESSLTQRFKYLKIPAASDYAMIFTTLGIALCCFFFGERITIGDGFGWDGQFSRTMVKDFFNQLVNVGVNDHRFQRILPCAIIHYSLRALSIPLTDYWIIKAFGIFNIMLLIFISYIWSLIADHLKISLKGKWLGFTAFFLNFAVLKWAFYNPTLTDISGYAIGITMLLLFLKNKLTGLYIVTVLGAFTWPIALFIGSLLLFFPKDDINPAPVRFHFNIILAALSAFIVFAGIKYALFHGYVIGFGVTKPVLPVINLSIACSLLYIFFGLKNILNNKSFFDLRFLIGKIHFKRQVIVVITFIAIKAIIFFGSHDHVGLGITKVFGKTMLLCIAQPFIFFISHILFYGPIIILALFMWKSVCRLIQNHGLGLTLCVILSFVLSLNSESRVHIFSYPLIVPFIIKAVDSLKWKKSCYWFMAVLSIILSKAWLIINTQPLNMNVPAEQFREFPFQFYFMNHGPWMSNIMYIVQGSVVLLCGAIIYFFLFHRSNVKNYA